MTKANPSNPIDVGILILSEGVDIGPLDFIELAMQRGEYLNPIKVDWIAGATSLFFEDGVYVTCERYPKQPSLHIFDLPLTINRDFSVSDLNFPVKIGGFVILVNAEVWANFVKELEEKGRSRKPINPTISDLAWAKMHNLPIVIGAFHAKDINRDSEQLINLLAQSISVPVVWCDGEMDENFVDRTLQTIYEELQK